MAAIATVGNFSMTCMTANTFGIDPPAENPTPLCHPLPAVDHRAAVRVQHLPGHVGRIVARQET